MFSYFKSEGQDDSAFTIAFYNLENLFDIVDDPNTIMDSDFTPEGKLKWSKKRYKKKIQKLTDVIRQLGTDKSFYAPAIVGVAEVENKAVMEDLVNHKNLKEHNYDFVHYNSPDERGIDVGLLFNKDLFEVLDSMVFPLFIDNLDGERDLTRDVLYVKGLLNGEIVYILVNHWPSRRDGTDETVYKRITAAQLNRDIAKIIANKNPDAKIIMMGDFNDDPTSESTQTLVQNDFYNPMQQLFDEGKGTLKYRDDWHLFDQIILSKSFLNPKKGTHSFKYAQVFNKDFLKVYRGKNKGKPFRTFISKWYQGGFSDHFPVHIYLKKN